MNTIARLTIFSTAMILAASCTKRDKDKEDTVPLPDSPVVSQNIEAGNSKAGILEISVLIEAEVMVLTIAEQPEGTDALICQLNDLTIEPCHHGANLALPPPGDHTLQVQAQTSEKTIAIGETRFSILEKTAAETPPSLEIYLTNKDFEDGSIWPRDQDLTLTFDLTGTPKCDTAPKFQCKYDSRTSAFWIPCTNKQFVVRKEIMANGLQYFAAQAVCGEELGPILTHSWYGVPKDYQPLMVQALKDNNDRYLVSPVKADDCPISQQIFECSKDETSPFLPCVNGNVLDQPEAGTRVRMACGDLNGPALTLK